MPTADELKALANNAVARSDFASAIRHLDDAVTLAPTDAAAFSNRAFAQSAVGHHAKALADAQCAMSLAPKSSKGYLRAGRALTALGRRDDAIALLEDAADSFPQDYALQEALESALSAAPSADGEAAGASSAPTSSASASSSAPDATAAGDGHGGLASSYYYAAVPSSQRVLPVTAPQKIDATTSSAAATGGAIKADIERKGSDSYYYAHDRTTDFTVPTVPKRLNDDGSLTPWDGK